MIKKQYNKVCFAAFFVIVLFFGVSLNAQISEGGIPLSFKYDQQTEVRQAIAPECVVLPVRISALKDEDQMRESEGGLVRVASLIPVNWAVHNSGTWTVLPGNEHIWRLRIQADGAVALMLYYDRFEIPEGGKLFIYSATKDQLLGAFTHRTNPGDGYFATEFVTGDDVILEYEAPRLPETPVIPDISIREIGYGYNQLAADYALSLRKAGSCEVNVNCEEGAAWQSEKQGVCRQLMRIGWGTYYCTGSLVNNTAKDLKPYILTACHCMEISSSEKASDSDMAQWIFQFHYEKVDCSNSSATQNYVSTTGCRRVASMSLNGGSDGLLLLLNKPVPSEYNVFYNGWDRSNVPAFRGVGIHHPDGDFMKISTFNKPAEHTTWRDVEQGLSNGHWNVIFNKTKNGHGVTEGGSSGSPLFNQNNLIVGTLTGGNSSCSFVAGLNLYGKLYAHWDKSGTKTDQRMDIYLDPAKVGILTLPGMPYSDSILMPVNLQAVPRENAVFLTWSAPAYYLVPVHYNIYSNQVKIGQSETLSYLDTRNPGNGGIYSVTAVYDNGSESKPIAGNQEIQTDNIRFYPNPIAGGDFLYLELSGLDVNGMQVTLSDSAGKIISQTSVTGTQNAVQAPVIAGTYVVTLHRGNETIKVEKVVVK